MKKHAFIMPVHRQPRLLARIIRVLQSDNHYFFVHVCGQVTNYQEFVDACQGLDNVVFVKRIPVYYADISQVYATLIMLDAVMKSPVRFDYVHQISGQDYPLRSNEQFDDFFENTEDSFMRFPARELLNDYMYNLIFNSQVNRYWLFGHESLCEKLFLRVAVSKIGQRYLKRKPIPNLAAGWDWFSWSYRVLKYVYDFTYSPEGKALLKRFRYTRAPGEHYWQTVLYPHIGSLHILMKEPLRYISWVAYRDMEQTHRPYDLTELDYERVINSAAFFCRKVDENTSARFLDMIDKQRGQVYDFNEHDYFM